MSITAEPARRLIPGRRYTRPRPSRLFLFLRRNKNEREERFYSSDTPNMIPSIWALNEARDQAFRIASVNPNPAEMARKMAAPPAITPHRPSRADVDSRPAEPSPVRTELTGESNS